MSPRAARPTVAELEGRLAPAINIVFDFRYDTSEFFTDHIDRITVLQTAADDVSSKFTDSLAAIPFPAAGNSWRAQFDRPSGLGEFVEIVNLPVPADTVVVFVGARDLPGNELVRPTSDREASGTADWQELVFGRGQANAFGSSATDYSPWGGSLTFDQFNDWHFGVEPPGGGREYDLYTAAVNGITHLLGFGSGEAWARLSASGSFTGPQATAVFGGPVPMSSGRFEWQRDVRSGSLQSPMDEEFEDGDRLPLTPLDLGAMADIGWQLAGTSPPPVVPPPPTAPAPPTIPPRVVPAGFDMLAVGAGQGAGPNSAFTFNEATTFTQVTQFAPFGASFTGGARVVTADVNADGVDDVIVGPGPGTPTEARIYSGATVAVDPNGSLLRVLPAFESSFTGGVYVAAGDVTGDGVPDVAITPDEGGGPRVRVFDGKTFALLADFFGIEDPNFRGGARAAVGDLNGDGTADLLVAAGFGGGPRLSAYDGKTLRPGDSPRHLFGDFFVFEQTLRNGVFVTSGDLDGDGFAEVIAGGGPGGGPRVFALSGKDLTQSDGRQTVLANFFAGDEANRGGVRLGVEDLDHDTRADLLTGAGTDALPVVTTYRGRDVTAAAGTPPFFQQFQIFDSAFTGGVFVG